jgi:hypothetical protein
VRRPARLAGIPGFGIDEVAEAAGDDPEVLRLENLDTDLPVPHGVVAGAWRLDPDRLRQCPRRRRPSRHM